MRIFQVIFMTFALLAGLPAALAQGAFGGGPAHIAAELDSESDRPW